MSYDLTVIVLTYNHSDTIVECLESIESQITSCKMNVLVMNDASTDNTAGIVSDWIDSVSNSDKDYHQLIQKFNVGPTKNGLAGWANIDSKYVAQIDGDDFWYDVLKVEKQFRLLEGNDNLSICCSSYVAVDTNSNVIRHIDLKPGIFGFNSFMAISNLNVQPCTVMIKYDSRIVRNYPEGFSGFNFLVNRLLNFGQVCVIEDRTAAYRISEKG